MPPAGRDGEGQSVEDRLHDVFMMTLYAAKDLWDGSRVCFEVLFQMREGPRFEKVQCVAIVSPRRRGYPGDDDQPSGGRIVFWRGRVALGYLGNLCLLGKAKDNRRSLRGPRSKN